MLWRFLFLLLSFFPPIVMAQNYTPVKLINGTAQIPQATNEIFKIQGDAQIIWNNLVSPHVFDAYNWKTVSFPKPWINLPEGERRTRGMATYRLHLQFPEQSLGQVWGIWFPLTFGASRIWVNHFEIPNPSIVARDVNKVQQRTSNLVHYFPIQSQDVEIVIQNINRDIHTGGFDWDFLLAPAEPLRKNLSRLSLLDAAILGSLLFSAIYHIWLYSFRRQWLPYLILGLFFLTAMVRIGLVSAGRWALGFELPEDTVRHLEVLTYYFMVILSLVIVQVMYYRETFRSWNLFLYFLGFAAIILTILLPLRFSNKLLQPFHLVTLSTFFTMMIIVIRAMIRRRSGSILFFLGMMAAIACSIFDLMHIFNIIKLPFYTVGPGLMIFALLACLFQASRFERIFQRLEKQNNSITQLNKDLEKQAIALEEEVFKRTEELNAILRHTEIGIFIFHEDDHGLMISPLISEASRRILDDQSIDIVKFQNFLRQSHLDKNEIAQAISALQASIGGLADLIEANTALLPPELRFNGADGNTQSYLCSWIPQIEDDTVTSILLTLADVSDEKKFAKSSQLHEQQQIRIFEILKLEGAKSSIFFRESLALLKRIDSYRQAAKETEFIDKAQIMRDLHTLKGLSRTYGFTLLADIAHQTEENILQNSKLSAAELDNALVELKECFNQYSQDIQKLTHQTLDNPFEEQDFLFDKLVHQATQIANGKAPADWLSQWQRFQKIYFISFRQLADTFRSSIRDIASRLEKPTPKLSVIGENSLFKRSQAGSLSGALVHLLRNAIDHGIEPVDIRRKLGKDIKGKITIKAKIQEDRLQIDLFDDGAGLNLDHIRKRAQSLGLIAAEQELSDEEIAAFIFLGNFSTKNQANEISGRGVGMDAVQDIIKELGGDLQIVWRDERRNGHRACSWQIQLPSYVAINEGI
ncbi:MAG: 7TM diverse intracellular signaling domain-containing protein [Oligoflexus sp.]